MRGPSETRRGPVVSLLAVRQEATGPHPHSGLGSRYLGEVTIAPITSTVRDIPSEVLLGPADGLPRQCVANLDHVQTVGKGRLGGLIATLPAGRMAEVRTALLFALGF